MRYVIVKFVDEKSYLVHSKCPLSSSSWSHLLQCPIPTPMLSWRFVYSLTGPQFTAVITNKAKMIGCWIIILFILVFQLPLIVSFFSPIVFHFIHLVSSFEFASRIWNKNDNQNGQYFRMTNLPLELQSVGKQISTYFSWIKFQFLFLFQHVWAIQTSTLPTMSNHTVCFTNLGKLNFLMVVRF